MRERNAFGGILKVAVHPQAAFGDHNMATHLLVGKAFFSLVTCSLSLQRSTSLCINGTSRFHGLWWYSFVRKPKTNSMKHSLSAVLGMAFIHSISLVCCNFVFIFSFSHFSLILISFLIPLSICPLHNSICPSMIRTFPLLHSPSFLLSYSSFFLHLSSNFFLYCFHISSSLTLCVLSFGLGFFSAF